MSFRSVPKGTIQRKVPESLIKELDLRAARERKHAHQFLTEVICLGLGIDPAEHGIDPAQAEPAPSPN